MNKKYILKTLIIILFSTQLYSQVNVTFKVDMSSETVSADGVHITGSINDWNTSSTTLTHEGTSSIYAVTIQLNTGWHEYKFLNGNAWGTEESAGYPCAPSNGNRYVYINDSGNDVTLEAVPFNGCNAESTGFEVTLNVDMSSETVSGDGVKIAGWLNGWNGDNLVVPNMDGNIYSATLRLPTPADYPITLEYKFINGSVWETPDVNCNTVVNTNRIETVTSSGQNIFNVFNGCNYTLSTDNNFLEDLNVYYKRNRGLIVQKKPSNNNVSIEIFDVLGKSVVSKTLLNNNTETVLNVDQLYTGLYILRINDGSNRSFSKKIIIENE